MKATSLNMDIIEEFIIYCKKHRKEIDESFLMEEDLNEFIPNEENPTYIATSEEGQVIATASLMINEYDRRDKKARFRIFHSEVEDIAYYRRLLEAIQPYTEDLETIFLFVPLENRKLMEAIRGLGFNIERYSFLLVREDIETPKYSLPEDYEIKDFIPNRDEEIYCEVRNAGFAKLKGSETPITTDMLKNKNMTDRKDYIEGGIKILYHQDKPVGVVRGDDDEYEGANVMNIGPLAILPEYQGKGLGRNLLRASLAFAKEKSYKRTILCVNAENEQAKTLYKRVGFQEVETLACYHYDLKSN